MLFLMDYELYYVPNKLLILVYFIAENFAMHNTHPIRPDKSWLYSSINHSRCHAKTNAELPKGQKLVSQTNQWLIHS